MSKPSIADVLATAFRNHVPCSCRASLDEHSVMYVCHECRLLEAVMGELSWLEVHRNMAHEGGK